MFTRTLISLAALTAIAAAAGPASAADTVVVPMAPDADVHRMTALDDTVVWIDGKRLMERGPGGGAAPVPGTGRANYASIDLGRDGSGATVLTYLICEPRSRCNAYSDDLAGHRVRFKRLAPKGCGLGSAPARWGPRVAYGLTCTKGTGRFKRFDAKASGLFVRVGAGKPTRLRMPSGLENPDEGYRIDTVDLRGTRVGALVGGTEGFSYEILQTVDGKYAHSAFVGGGGEEARDFAGGVSVGSGRSLWTLQYGYESSQVYSAIRRLKPNGCTEYDRLRVAPAAYREEEYPATAMAVDGARIYLFVRGKGIVAHTFTPMSACA